MLLILSFFHLSGFITVKRVMYMFTMINAANKSLGMERRGEREVGGGTE